MATPVPTDTAKAGAAAHISRLIAFASSSAAKPALLGLLGAALITVGGLGAGSTRQHDPLLETLHLSWLRFGHGLVLSSILLWGGVALMLTAWLWLGRRVVDRTASEYTMIATTGFWLAPLLLSVPVFSRDTYSYLAQGALLRDGFDPYTVGPIANPNPLLDDVSPIWTTTTAPYGPAFIMVAKFVTMVIGDNVVAGTMLLRLCMLPGLLLLIWAAPRVARHVGASGAAALWICVLNPLVIIHLMGGVHNEMLMVGLMMAGLALTLDRHPVAGVSVVVVAVAVKATAGLALPFTVWIWMRQIRERRGYSPPLAFAAATAAGLVIFAAVFTVLSWVAGVGVGWLNALAAGNVKIINWLTLPTAVANLTNAIGGLFLPVNFYAVIDVTRIVGIAVIAISLPLLWWRFRHTDREALVGIAAVMGVFVLLVPAALPWYYTWPLAVLSALAQSRSAIALIAGFSTWIMVIFKPDGAHGMYSWVHVLLAAGCAVAAWYSLARAPEPAAVGQ
ncbi:alpha-(1-_6)-mannopyranosyltransferase A [Mycobacterium sp. PS03-16]|uniref:alpha-(1->6)-mannopyranosyltransferase A n=1 Tax=Mycobacterium sp. PS03-16 TaxID=2559611 RepID=UPI00107458E9|nr:alpha-(1->6)-mannopyranosyltransferase A [Mycobacterium sp. PS03-16]TFV60597.1 alpha-(1->6)-mannopyranosyltransferase A [Mycobacterium sp. PS03-16]